MFKKVLFRMNSRIISWLILILNANKFTCSGKFTGELGRRISSGDDLFFHLVCKFFYKMNFLYNIEVVTKVI